MSDHFRHHAPAAWNAHWDGLPNAVRALYGVFQRTDAPWDIKEVRIEAWGQLCSDRAAANAVAYHMHNNGMRTGWRYLAWRCEMDAPPVGGGKLSGLAPSDFDIYKYVPERYREAS